MTSTPSVHALRRQVREQQLVTADCGVCGKTAVRGQPYLTLILNDPYGDPLAVLDVCGGKCLHYAPALMRRELRRARGD